RMAMMAITTSNSIRVKARRMRAMEASSWLFAGASGRAARAGRQGAGNLLGFGNQVGDSAGCKVPQTNGGLLRKEGETHGAGKHRARHPRAARPLAAWCTTWGARLLARSGS